MTNEQKQTLQSMIVEAGTELATKMMSDVIATAKSREEMNSGMGALQHMASHIGATWVYNWIVQDGMTREAAVQKYMAFIEAEVTDMLANKDKIEILAPGDRLQPKAVDA